MRVTPGGWKGWYCSSHVLLRPVMLRSGEIHQAYLIFDPSTCPEYSTAVFIIERFPISTLGRFGILFGSINIYQKAIGSESCAMYWVYRDDFFLFYILIWMGPILLTNNFPFGGAQWYLWYLALCSSWKLLLILNICWLVKCDTGNH